MNAPDKKAHRDGVSPKPDEHRPVAAVIDRLNPDRSVGPSAPPSKGDSSSPRAEPDDNIEMVAPAVQEQTGSER
jgi:hypothetical protein